ncbi:alpha/beta hydrolase [Candidatus Sumerlaeota bacterium]|nr:alpha/beta hydrolase [Candidatus Sumerlaeota bacterium]
MISSPADHGRIALEGILECPRGAKGIVLFAHGSGSSRLSPRNQYVASALREAGFATLLFDLLTEREFSVRSNVFDIGVLANRLIDATRRVMEDELVGCLPIGYFGASTGAAAALVAAALLQSQIHAVVSRGGRPDMANRYLDQVNAATLLIVGSEDEGVIQLNQAAYDRLRCEKSLRLVAGATHLFEEHGALEEVVRLANHWFNSHLGAAKKGGRDVS